MILQKTLASSYSANDGYYSVSASCRVSAWVGNSCLGWRELLQHAWTWEEWKTSCIQRGIHTEDNAPCLWLLVWLCALWTIQTCIRVCNTIPLLNNVDFLENRDAEIKLKHSPFLSFSHTMCSLCLSKCSSMESRIAVEDPSHWHRLQAVPPDQTVWLAVPITSEVVQKQHIFWSHSVPQRQPAVINTTVERSGKSQITTDHRQRGRYRWTSCNCFIESVWLPWLLTVQGPNTVIRGSELLMARPRRRKRSCVVVCPRTSFLCGCTDPIN